MDEKRKWWFSKVPKSVVEDGQWAEMKGAMQAVFVVLCHHANKHYRSWPGVKRLMRSSGYSRRMVQFALRQLKGLGVIVDLGRDPDKGTRLWDIPGLHPPAEKPPETAC